MTIKRPSTIIVYERGPQGKASQIPGPPGQSVQTLSINLDNAPNIIDHGVYGNKLIPYNSRIKNWLLKCDIPGMVIIDIERSNVDDIDNWQSVTNGSPIHIDNEYYKFEDMLSWSDLNQFDIIRVNILNNSNVKRLFLHLTVEKI